MIRIEKKSRALNRPRFGCLEGLYAINITRGCEFRCVYCYARGYPDSPKDDVYLYVNLPDKLAHEIRGPRIRANLRWVIFGTACDCFQSHPEVLDITYRCMSLLLQNGIGISFLTKGWIPHRFIDLFSNYPNLVIPKIGIVSVSEKYRKVFEPYAPAINQRVDNLKRLHSAGIPPQVRVDPVVPFLTDTEGEIIRLCEAICAFVKRITISYLHLRPMIIDQLKSELPARQFNLLMSCYKKRDWVSVGTSTKTALLPSVLRMKGYKRFSRISNSYGIRTSICGCKNPDITQQKCTELMIYGKSPPDEYQMSLFQ